MIKAVIADDSPFLRQVLKDVLHESRKINVVGEAKNGKEAIQIVKALKPDVLILDCEMPVMNGLEALRRIMAECPLPVFVFSSLTSEGSSVTLRALEYGAVDFLLKPTRGAHALTEVATDLIKKVQCVALRGKFRTQSKGFQPRVKDNKVAPAVPKLTKGNIDLIAVGSSTGGVQAAVEVVKRLPENTKPIVWVQHMPANFTASFAQRLNSLSKITVKEAKDGDRVEHGSCYIAPGGMQMQIQRHGNNATLKVGGIEKVSGHCPSCNVLFGSVSEHYSKNVLGVILTGMGDDGTKGLVQMHNKGSFVIGQNQESCVVYGMPKAAFQAGAVDIEVDINDIAETIVKKGG